MSVARPQRRDGVSRVGLLQVQMAPAAWKIEAGIVEIRSLK